MNATYTVSAIKTTRGMEGYGFSCNLLKNGKKVAECLDDASGGPTMIHFIDKGTAQIAPTVGDSYTFEGTPEEAAFYAHVNSLPKIPANEAKGYPEMTTTVDIVIYHLVNDTRDLESAKKAVKKSIFIRKADGVVAGYKMSGSWTPTTLTAAVQKQNPGCTILNSMPIAELFPILRANHYA